VALRKNFVFLTSAERTRLASAFNAVGEIWAPRYRQAAYGAFLLDNPDARAALGLAYSDVARAFDRFLAEVPPRPPIVPAGHSQGALPLVRLRAQAMQEAVPEGTGGIAVIVGLDFEKVAAICAAEARGEALEPANLNSPIQTVIAGHREATRVTGLSPLLSTVTRLSSRCAAITVCPLSLEAT